MLGADEMVVAIFILMLGIGREGTANISSRFEIHDFGRINDNYYRGAQPHRDDYPRLAALGIKAVVDLRQDGPADEEILVERAGMKFYRIRMGTGRPPSETAIRQFLQIVNDPGNQPVFVHCEDGHIRNQRDDGNLSYDPRRLDCRPGIPGDEEVSFPRVSASSSKTFYLSLRLTSLCSFLCLIIPIKTGGDTTL